MVRLSVCHWVALGTVSMSHYITITYSNVTSTMRTWELVLCAKSSRGLWLASPEAAVAIVLVQYFITMMSCTQAYGNIIGKHVQCSTSHNYVNKKVIKTISLLFIGHVQVLGKCISCACTKRSIEYCRIQQQHQEDNAQVCSECFTKGNTVSKCRRELQHKQPNGVN